MHTEAGTGAELPRFIKGEFEAFLEPGMPVHGFLRLRCSEYGPGPDALRKPRCQPCPARGLPFGAAPDKLPARS